MGAAPAPEQPPPHTFRERVWPWALLWWVTEGSLGVDALAVFPESREFGSVGRGPHEYRGGSGPAFGGQAIHRRPKGRTARSSRSVTEAPAVVIGEKVLVAAPPPKCIGWSAAEPPWLARRRR